MLKNVFINQCGYLPEMVKKVTIRTENPCSFIVAKSTGEKVFEGKADVLFNDEASGDKVYVGDFSSVKESGRYYIIAENMSESDIFEIGNNVYHQLFQDTMKFFYLQRCGCNLSKKDAGLYAHTPCHTGIASVYGSSQKIEVSGGWHDAGDYGRYIVPAAVTIAQLLMAFEKNNTLCSLYKNDYEGKICKNLPDFLEEIKYELDWMLKLQREDGKVYHKATPYNFCGFIMPQEETAEMVLSPVSVTATADFAACLAMAVKFYKPYDESYASILEERAKKAYDALDGFVLEGGFLNPKEITTGEYCDKIDVDEKYWAAAEMYKAFGNNKYRSDFESIAQEKIYEGYGWEDVGTYGNLAYISTTFETSSDLKEKIKASIIQKADNRLSVVESSGYGAALSKDEYIWGSNFYDANNALHLYDAYELTGNKKYLEAASQQLSYLLGRNANGICYVTGEGTYAVSHPHHRPSGNMGKAMAGMLSGGPCSWFADATIQGVRPKTTAPAKAFVDMTGSYSTNEVTIYWNSAFVLLLAYIQLKLS